MSKDKDTGACTWFHFEAQNILIVIKSNLPVFFYCLSAVSNKIVYVYMHLCVYMCICVYIFLSIYVYR